MELIFALFNVHSIKMHFYIMLLVIGYKIFHTIQK